jgi:adenylate kinase
MIRAEVAAGSELGRETKKYLDAGALVPDDVILSIVEAKMKADASADYLLDGFPRTIPQAEGLDRILAGLNRTIDAVLSLEVAEETIVERLGNRRICPVDGRVYNLVTLPPRVPGRCDDHPERELEHRNDDRPETVRHRFEVYRQQTSPLIDFYQRRNLLRDIDGVGAPEDVADRIDATLKQAGGLRRA